MFASRSGVNSKWLKAVRIGPMRTLKEAKSCAEMLLKSEPWVTLRFDFQTTFAALRDPAREVYVARVEKQLAGFIVLNLRGPLLRERTPYGSRTN